MCLNTEHNKSAQRAGCTILLYELNMAYEFSPQLPELFMRFYEVVLEGIVTKLSFPVTVLFRCIIE